MNDSETVLSYLVPRLTNQVEDAATEVLGYILNRSPQCRESLQGMLEQGAGFKLDEIDRVDTQVAYEDGSRPDMTGYDRAGLKRLLVESKFWAALRKGQPDYIDQFDHASSAALLFIAPQSRIETLWSEILRQFRDAKVELEPGCSAPDLRSANLVQGARQAARAVILTSWRRLLDDLNEAVGGAGVVAAEILQLRGLAVRQDRTAFLPLHAEDVGPEFGRRMMAWKRLVDTVCALGVTEQWLTSSLKTPQYYGPGQTLHFRGGPSRFWFGINCEQWARRGDTPLWLWNADPALMARIATAQSLPHHGKWIPIHPLLGVEYQTVLDGVVATLRKISQSIESGPQIT